MMTMIVMMVNLIMTAALFYDGDDNSKWRLSLKEIIDSWEGRYVNAACWMLTVLWKLPVGALRGSDLVKDPLTERAGDVFLNPDGFITYQRAYFADSIDIVSTAMFQPNEPEAKSQIHGSWLKPSHIWQPRWRVTAEVSLWQCEVCAKWMKMMKGKALTKMIPF